MFLRNKKGSVLILAMVLSIAVLPAAVVLAGLARTDLAAALDDYHHVKAGHAARGALALIKADLIKGGPGLIAWPDPETTLTYIVNDKTDAWDITVTAFCGGSVAEASARVRKSEDYGQ